MNVQYILSEYLDHAMAQAEYDKPEDGTFSGRIPSCKGVIAFGNTLHECEIELRSTLEDWLLVGLKLGHSLPIIDGIDLNKDMTLEEGVQLESNLFGLCFSTEDMKEGTKAFLEKRPANFQGW